MKTSLLLIEARNFYDKRDLLDYVRRQIDLDHEVRITAGRVMDTIEYRVEIFVENTI